MYPPFVVQNSLDQSQNLIARPKIGEKVAIHLLLLSLSVQITAVRRGVAEGTDADAGRLRCRARRRELTRESGECVRPGAERRQYRGERGVGFDVHLEGVGDDADRVLGRDLGNFADRDFHLQKEPKT